MENDVIAIDIMHEISCNKQYSDCVFYTKKHVIDFTIKIMYNLIKNNGGVEK